MGNGQENIRNSWDISFEDIRRIILKTSKRHEKIVTSLKETLGTRELFSSILQPWDRKREENKRVKWKGKEREWCSIVATREKNDEILLISGAKAVRDLFFHYFSTNGTVLLNNASRYVLTYVYVWFNHNETAISSTWYWYLVQLVNHVALQNTRLRVSKTRRKLNIPHLFVKYSSFRSLLLLFFYKLR